MATEMRKLPPKWDFGQFFAIFSTSTAIFKPISGRGPFAIFFSIFPGFLCRTGFPFCRWPPKTQLFQSLRGFTQCSSSTSCYAHRMREDLCACQGHWRRGHGCKKNEKRSFLCRCSFCDWLLRNRKNLCASEVSSTATE